MKPGLLDSLFNKTWFDGCKKAGLINMEDTVLLTADRREFVYFWETYGTFEQSSATVVVKSNQ